MWAHRITGLLVGGFGLALLVGQMTMLYGSAGQQRLMVDIGLPGVAVLTSVGAISFAVGCLLATAPHAARRHLRRVTALGSRRKTAPSLRHPNPNSL